MQKKWFNIVLIFIGLLAAFYFYNKYRVAPSINFEQLSLSYLDGQPAKFNNFKGKKMIVCFGASWCGNCREELSTLKEVKNKDLNDVEVIVISDEPIDRVASLQNLENFPFTFLKMAQSFNEIGINSIPTSYIVNSELKVKKETVGYLNWEDPSLLEHIKKLLE